MLELIKEYYIQLLLITLTTGLIQQYYKYRAVQKGLTALLRNELVKSHREHENKKFMKVHERFNFLEMYNAYKTLGGNDVVTDLWEDLKDLPTEKGE